MTISCMGGMCPIRDRCRHHQAEDRSHPIERLCEPGERDAFERVPLQPVIPKPWVSMIHQISDREAA